jgi:hypothetical protein
MDRKPDEVDRLMFSAAAQPGLACTDLCNLAWLTPFSASQPGLAWPLLQPWLFHY